MTFKLLTEQYLEFLSLKGGYLGLSESIHVKMPHCWKSHVTAHIELKVAEQYKQELLHLPNILQFEPIKLHEDLFILVTELWCLQGFYNNQRGITQKLRKGEQSFLFDKLPLPNIYFYKIS